MTCSHADGCELASETTVPQPLCRRHAIAFYEGLVRVGAALAVLHRDVEDPMVGLMVGRALAVDLPTQVAALERTVIREVLVKTAYNRRAAAAVLGVPRSTLHEKIRRYGLWRGRPPGRPRLAPVEGWC